MRIVSKLLSPIVWTLTFIRNVTASVANRIFLDVYTKYHFIRQDEMAYEIDNLSRAIQALEADQIANEFLSPLLQNSIYKLTDIVDQRQLLTTLKTHRYSLLNLYNGVINNPQLCAEIYNYVFNPVSPARKPPPPRQEVNPIPFHLDEK